MPRKKISTSQSLKKRSKSHAVAATLVGRPFACLQQPSAKSASVSIAARAGRILFTASHANSRYQLLAFSTDVQAAAAARQGRAAQNHFISHCARMQEATIPQVNITRHFRGRYYCRFASRTRLFISSSWAFFIRFQPPGAFSPRAAGHDK